MMSNNIDKESFNKNIKETEDSYKNYVYTDDITGLEYLDWEDYLDHKDLFPVDKHVIELIINSDIVSDIRDIDKRLFSLYVAIDYIFSETDFNCKEYIIWKEKINNLYFDLENDYKDSNNHEGSWKYISLSIDDLYNDICKRYNFASTISLSELFSDDYYFKLMYRNMEEK